MITTCNFTAGRWIRFWLVFFCLQAAFPCLSEGYSQSQYQRFQDRLIDHRSRLNPKFKKKIRQKTQYIIVHTSELGLDATLRVVSRGKQFKSGYKTPGGHAHYVIARNGRNYRILDKRYRADHAGRSMWKGRTDISDVSLGIELAGYHNAPITKSQYRSIETLIQILEKVYGLKDQDVLTHSQAAYGKPNPWFKKNHRGRKRCAQNFNRAKAGLGHGLQYDPDVRAGRLMADPTLAGIFYAPFFKGPVPLAAPREYGSNIISTTNSAWSIAGGDYDENTTVYILPDGRTLPGDKISTTIGWTRLPLNTKVLLNQDIEPAVIQIQTQVPVKIITHNMTAWSHAGVAYREDTTLYFLPSGRVYPGSKISDWDDLPLETRMLVGYRGPFPITRAQTAYKIAGQKYKAPETIYYISPGILTAGDKISDFSDLPRGVQMYLPLALK
ncbi:MAG: N-acetylmuramoyl-L-alanine amidase [Deltaproteobacteria bacterium]|nr:MAG: N-acetylmuramoyl-L-alanine amidase [Deltaproteobacteria bacterium]